MADARTGRSIIPFRASIGNANRALVPYHPLAYRAGLSCSLVMSASLGPARRRVLVNNGVDHRKYTAKPLHMTIYVV